MKKRHVRERKRMILVRDSFPYLGGSSTFLYLLFEKLHQKIPVECWNIVTSRMSELGKTHYGPHWGNPKGFPNVKTFIVDGRRGLGKVREALKEKPVAAIVSKSRRTTYVLKRLIPSIPMWHLTSTCSIVKNAIANEEFTSMEDAIRQLRKNHLLKLHSAEEHQAIRAADKILFHTESMRFWYYTFYPQYFEKMEEEIFWDYSVLKKEFSRLRTDTPWEKRPIDLLFVASDWKRPEKNFPLLKSICRSLRTKKIMVVGFLPERLPGRVLTFDNMSQDEVIQAMVQTKVVACPSRYDEAPNVLFEAAIAGANIVCSKNCGNYQIAPDDFVARLEVRDFRDKIKKALHHYRPPETRHFTKNDLGQWILQYYANPTHKRKKGVRRRSE